MTDATKLADGLTTISAQIKSWLSWDRKHRQENRPPLTTVDGTHIMSLPVPFWPSHGSFQSWIELFEEAAAAFRTQPGTPSREGEVQQFYGEIYHANGCTMNDGEAVLAAIRNFLPPAPTTEPVAWVSPETLATLQGPNCGAALHRITPISGVKGYDVALYAAPPVAAPEDAVREALEDMIDLATNISPYALSTNTKARLARARAALPAKDWAAAVTRPNSGGAA